MFEKLIGSIDYEVARRIFRVQVAQRPQPQQVPPGEEVHPEAPEAPEAAAKKKEKLTKTSDFTKAFAKAGSSASQPVTAKQGKKKKIGRNDPCFCGSGKKWKKCHYPDKG